MKKIVLSSLVALTLGTVSATAGDVTFYQDANGQVFTQPAEGRVAINLEKAAEVLNAKEEPKQKAANGFWDRFHAKGDLRLRQEVIKKDPDTTALDKNRERYRFRYGVNVDITDNILLETAISSGKYNPTSGNVTFNNNNGSTHDEIQNYFIDELKIDILDIKYSFDNSWVRVGKAAHHIYRPVKTQLVWDNDIRLEGVNYGYKSDDTMIRLGVNRLHREHGYKGGANDNDINIFVAQYVHTAKLDNAKLNLGAAYYHYDGVKGSTDPYGSHKNNSNVDGLYTKDYQIAEAFAEIKFKDVLGKPFKIAAMGVNNFGASNDNIGYDISAQYGAAKKVGQWQAAATYRKVEKDAVFGAHNDSDFSGGGTDNKGYYVKAKYKFAKNVFVQGWWNWSDTQISTGNTIKYYRHQLDVILKF